MVAMVATMMFAPYVVVAIGAMAVQLVERRALVVGEKPERRRIGGLGAEYLSAGRGAWACAPAGYRRA